MQISRQLAPGRDIVNRVRWESKIRNLLIMLASAFMIAACETDDQTEKNIMNDPSLQEELQTLSALRIFFGHQSVGANIVEGIRDLLEQHKEIPLTLISLSDSNKITTSFFADAKVGYNTNYESKCSGFSDAINHIFAGNLDIAVLKFCYIDISHTTDIHRMLAYYKATVDSLKDRYPRISFVYVTDPLMHQNPWWKRMVLRVLGRDDYSVEDNIRRNEFNRLLLQEFAGKPVFDLAAAESTYPDGSKESFGSNGNTYTALVPMYTDDGAHLNRLGRIVVARAMIKMLSNAAAIRSAVR
jgi:hypothetical protein